MRLFYRVVSLSVMFLIINGNICGQMKVKFIPVIGQDTIFEGVSNYNDSLLLEIYELKMYVGNFSSYVSNDVPSKDNYYLLDFVKIAQPIIEIDDFILRDTLSFNVGVDSITTMKGALEGDLDPMNGMYWTWHTGYINLKFEGRHMNASARNQEFQIHLGGYQYPYRNDRRIVLQVDAGSEAVTIYFELDKLIKGIDFINRPQVMSPSEHSLKLCNLYHLLFNN